MFVIRRVWSVHPRQARLAASVALELVTRYQEIGQREGARVYFNGATLPGERDRLYMEWIDDSIASTYRPDRVGPEGIAELSARLRELTIENWVEFNELMTPDKAVPLD